MQEKKYFLLQGLYELPPSLVLKFRVYLNILPVAEKVLTYVLLMCGSVFLLYALYKFLQVRSTKAKFDSPWIEDDLVYNIDRKLSSYIPEKRSSSNAKEMELFMDSLIVPLTRDVHETVWILRLNSLYRVNLFLSALLLDLQASTNNMSIKFASKADAKYHAKNVSKFGRDF